MHNHLSQPRYYRCLCQSAGLGSYRVCMGESDLFIRSDRDIRVQAFRLLSIIRQELETYIESDLTFVDSLGPVSITDTAPDLVQHMARAAACVDVGPMATVAGAISEEIARGLYLPEHDIIVENGGDIFAFAHHPLTVALYAGPSLLSMRTGLIVKNCNKGMAICTSSSSVGHSLSFGNADAVTIIAHDGYLADAVATALGNVVQDEKDIDRVLKRACAIDGVTGAVIIVKGRIGIQGKQIELCHL